MPELLLSDYCDRFLFLNLTLPAINRRGFLVQRNHLTKKSLRHLDQRWDSPQALTFRVSLGSCIAASPVLLETICSKILSRVSTSLNTSLAPMNLLPTARRKLEQCSRTDLQPIIEQLQQGNIVGDRTRALVRSMLFIR
jgi:hypothetical protein